MRGNRLDTVRFQAGLPADKTALLLTCVESTLRESTLLLPRQIIIIKDPRCHPMSGRRGRVCTRAVLPKAAI